MWAKKEGSVAWLNGPVEVREGDRLVMSVADGESRPLTDVIEAVGGKNRRTDLRRRRVVYRAALATGMTLGMAERRRGDNPNV